MTDAGSRSLTYRPDVDGLRALAVLCVVGFHFLPNRVTGGFIGVDVFFVVSGYLISAIILKGLERGRFSFAQFYARRIRRIFPAALLIMSVCLAVGWRALLADDYAHLGRHVAAGSGFVSNVALWRESGYFDTDARLKPLLHLWSLGIEEQFYLLWPSLLYLAWAGRAHRLAVTSVLAASFAVNVLVVTRHPIAAFYLPFSRFWELAAGSALASFQIAGSARPVPMWMRDVAGALGLIMIAASIVIMGNNTAFPGWAAAVPVAGTCLVIWAGADAVVNRTVLSHPVLVFLGLISYPLYLWHWPLLSFASLITQQFPGLALRGILLGVSVLLAWLTYVLIERPIRARRGARMPILLLAAAVVVAAAGYATWAGQGFAGRIVTKNDFPVNRHAMRDGSIALAGTTDCAASLLAQPNTFCRTTQNPAIAVIGDSHAQRLFIGLAASGDPLFDKVMLTAMGMCHPMLGVDSTAGCSDQVDAELRLIEATPTARVVLLAALSAYALQAARTADVTSQEILFHQGYSDTIARLLASNRDVYFVMDAPTLPFDPETCIEERPFHLAANSAPSDCAMSREMLNRQRVSYNALVAGLQRAHPRLHVFDPTDLFCDATRCRAIVDGLLQYEDYHHLSKYGSLRVARALLARVRADGFPP